MQDKSKRPLVTFALFAFNHEQYIRDAVLGALSQTYESLEIILSDDCSTDSTFEIMKQVVSEYQGSHRVHLRRNPINLGLASHVNSVLMGAKGEIIVLAAGDDISLPERTADSVDLLNRNETASSVLMSGDVINQDGEVVSEKIISKKKGQDGIQSLYDLLRWNHVTFGACRAFRAEVFTTFGPLRDDCPTEDTPLLLRSLMLGENILSPKKGILYRRHDSNLSGVDSMLKMNIYKIYAQYEDDIYKAQGLELLDSVQIEDLRLWIKSDLRARTITLRSLSKSKLSVSDFLFVIRHPKFSVKQVLSLFFSMLR